MKDKLIFYIEPNTSFSEGIRAILYELAHYVNKTVLFEDKKEAAAYIVGQTADCHIFIIDSVWRELRKGAIERSVLNSKMIFEVEDKIDLLATAFYFMNCLWEKDDDQQTDHWGRASFTGSIWDYYGYKAPFRHVNNVFDQLVERLGISRIKQPSKLFLSHDIDAVYSAWLEDGKAAIKAGKIGRFFRLILNKMSNKPDWFNFGSIADLELQHDSLSCFFWITEQGKVQGVGTNADYDITSEAIKNALTELSKCGAEHGLHKSISDTTFQEELNRMPITVIANRYHYLKFSFVELVNDLDESLVQMDASLGYAEVMGYRNGYSLPFRPFTFKDLRPATFIEVPLTIMDATLSRYAKDGGDAAWEKIRAFMEEYANDALISVLWHNTHFTNYKYKGYPAVYKRILQHGRAFEKVLPTKIIQEYNA